jgi:hypothetical protein
MSKSKKKRNKLYRGEDAAVQSVSTPVVHHYKAIQRSPTGEWWHDHKRAVGLGAKIGGGGIVVIWLLAEGIRLLVAH